MSSTFIYLNFYWNIKYKVLTKLFNKVNGDSNKNNKNWGFENLRKVTTRKEIKNLSKIKKNY